MNEIQSSFEENEESDNEKVFTDDQRLAFLTECWPNYLLKHIKDKYIPYPLQQQLSAAILVDMREKDSENIEDDDEEPFSLIESLDDDIQEYNEYKQNIVDEYEEGEDGEDEDDDNEDAEEENESKIFCVARPNGQEVQLPYTHLAAKLATMTQAEVDVLFPCPTGDIRIINDDDDDDIENDEE